MDVEAVDSQETKRALEADNNADQDGREVKRLKQNTEPSDNAERTKVQTDDVVESNDVKKDITAEQVDLGINFNKKKKCVLLLSYCGSGYSGMQRNPGVATIEEDLTNALLRANAISEDASRNYGKMSFQRCARTDKGVSAARQVVSLKMVPYAKLLPEINKHLKPQIRVFALKKVTRGFDCKNRCSSRTYEYLIPTLAFSQSYAHTAPNFRITNEFLERINSILLMYVGTHNFHNFTSGKAFKEESAKRYMMDVCYVDAPFIEQEMEFLSLRIKGQSFMQHQIRKMIGLLIAIIRNCTDRDAITRAFQEPKMDIPRAPGLGLILDQVDFESYNKKFGKDKIHEPLEWDDNEEEIRQFKKDYIYKTIIDTEVKTNSMLRWLSTLSAHSYGSNGMEKPQDKSKTAEKKVENENTEKTNENSNNEQELKNENNIEANKFAGTTEETNASDSTI